MSPATITKLEALKEQLAINIKEDQARLESVRAIVAMCDKVGEVIVVNEDSVRPMNLNNELRDFERRLCCQIDLLIFLEGAM